MQQIDYIVGDALDSHLLNVQEAFKDEHFLYSVWPFYKSKNKLAKLAACGIHDYVGHAAPIMLDSGGFQMVRKAANITPADTMRVYAACKMQKGDYAVCLDHCARPNETLAERVRKIKLTNANYLSMSAEDPRVLHVIHGWTRKELELSLSPLVGNGTIAAYGSYFAMMTLPANLTMMTMNIGLDELLKDASLKQLIIRRFLVFLDLLREKKLDEYKIHVLGASSGNSSHCLWYAGMDQMDSANWRVKAAYGKIAFPGKTEVKVSKNKSTFGATVWRDGYDALLKACECPACRGLSLSERRELLGTSFKARAVHNVHVYLEERQIARDLTGTLAYRRYLEKRFVRSTFWKLFFNKINESRHQKTLDAFVKL